MCMLASETTKWETRASAQSGCLGARARSPTRGGGLLHHESIGGGTTLFFRQQGNYLSRGWSLTHEVESSQREGGVSQYKDHKDGECTKLSVAQDHGRLCQCEASGATSTWVRRFHHLTVHTNTNNINVKGRGPNPMYPIKHVRSSVLSGSMLWRGFAWKFSPPSQGLESATITHT